MDNHMKVLRKIIEIDEERCDGCGQCVPDCAEGALQIVDGKVRMLGEQYCDGLGACLGSCPQEALRIVEREADEFNVEAVEKLLQSRKTKKEETSAAAPPPVFDGVKIKTPCQAANKPRFNLAAEKTYSSLSHWPVQIRLVPPQAPFLKDADLLVAADCVPVAYPHFHRDLLAGRVIMMGCPKFDDVNGYVQKFVEVFKNAKPRSIKLAIMEVPCCGGMRMIVKEALKQAGQDIPVEEVIVTARGEMKR
jgi:Pyruvate/2-oxoacid:ferredoxin oxidoreductase delta subunit